MSAYRIVVVGALALLVAAQSPRAQDGLAGLEEDFAAVCQTAFERSHQPDVADLPPPLPAFDPPPDGARAALGLVYEEYNAIKTIGWLHNSRVLWLTTRPRGNVHKAAIEVAYAPGAGRQYQPWTYRASDYDYRAAAIVPPLPLTIPPAARVISALEFGAAFGRSGSWPQIGYLGSSAYVRLAGFDTVFGTSLRLSGYHIGFAEAKPRLTQVNVRPLLHERLAFHGVIESAPYTACVQLVVTADLSTRAQTTLRFYPRVGVLGARHARVSPFAMSSMFWKDETQTPRNRAAEAHDADQMVVCGQPPAPLRELVPAVGRKVVRDFGTADCFGLLQRDRDPAHYKTYAAAKYAQRVNFWVDDLRSSQPCSIKLMAFGTNYEGEDNVVAYAEFVDPLPVPRSAAAAATFSYTLTAAALPPPQTGPRISFDGAGAPAQTGQAVALSGATVAVGAPAGRGRLGSVYLLKRTPHGLIAQRQLTPHDGAAGDQFGTALAMAGDTLVVAAHGAAYVFARRGQDWVQQAQLAVPVADNAAALRYAVAIAGERIAVGVPGDDGGQAPMTDDGAVYVFRRYGEHWPREATLRAADQAAWDHFGAALAFDGDTLAIGAPGDDYPKAWEQGSVYLFQRHGGTWTQEAKLTEPGGWKDYGAALALAGDRLLVGVPRAHGDGASSAAGAVCAYTREGRGWSLNQCFRPAEGRRGDRFGSAVGLSGTTAVIGAPGAQDGEGAAWLYYWVKGTWRQGGRLTGAPGAGGPFGVAVATDGAAHLIGAPAAPGKAQAAPGEAYLVTTGAR